jgi:hypothetical protein
MHGLHLLAAAALAVSRHSSAMAAASYRRLYRTVLDEQWRR